MIITKLSVIVNNMSISIEIVTGRLCFVYKHMATCYLIISCTSIFLSPKTFNCMPTYFCIVCGFDGVRCCFLSSESNESISFIPEHPHVLDLSELWESGVHEVFRDDVTGKAPAVHCGVGRGALVVHFVEGGLLGSLTAGRTLAGPVGGGLACGPVGPYRARAQPLPVHGLDGWLRIGLLHEWHERVPFGFESLRIANYAAVRDLSEGSECLAERVCLDLGREVANEDVMMVARVRLRLIAGTRGPVYLHLLVEEHSLVHGGQRRRRGRVSCEFQKRVGVISGLADNLTSFDFANLREQGTQELLRNCRVQVTDVESFGVALVAHIKRFACKRLLGNYNERLYRGSVRRATYYFITRDIGWRINQRKMQTALNPQSLLTRENVHFRKQTQLRRISGATISNLMAGNLILIWMNKITCQITL